MQCIPAAPYKCHSPHPVAYWVHGSRLPTHVNIFKEYFPWMQQFSNKHTLKQYVCESVSILRLNEILFKKTFNKQGMLQIHISANESKRKKQEVKASQSTCKTNFTTCLLQICYFPFLGCCFFISFFNDVTIVTFIFLCFLHFDK